MTKCTKCDIVCYDGYPIIISRGGKFEQANPQSWGKGGS